MPDQIHRIVNCARCGRKFDHVQDARKPWHPELCFCDRCDGGAQSKLGDILKRIVTKNQLDK